jgi:hypothetical protein
MILSMPKAIVHIGIQLTRNPFNAPTDSTGVITRRNAVAQTHKLPLTKTHSNFGLKTL